jgi:hypothetical protein
MLILLALSLGGILLVANVLGALGLLCTRDRHALFPGLLFGLPTIVLSLVIYTFFVGADVVWLGAFSAPSLIIGSLVVWRGLRNGKKPRDYLSALAVCAGVGLMGFLLLRYPEISRTVLSYVLPASPML